MSQKKAKTSTIAKKTTATKTTSSGKTNTLAIVGLILAIFIAPIGLILSIIALVKINKSKEGGKGLAIAGIIIGSLFTLGIIGMGGGNKGTTNQSTSNKASTSSAPKANNKTNEIAKIGQPVRDGKFEFTVTSFSCGTTSVGDNPYLTKQAQGQFCILNLNIKNIGDKAQSLFSGNQKLLNGNTQFSADDTATFYNQPSGSSSTWFNDINPGNSVSGSIVFDVPKDVTPTQAELHDSAFSGGVKVDLK